MKKISKLDRAVYIIAFFTVLLAAFAIGVGLDVIEIGEKGVQFLF